MARDRTGVPPAVPGPADLVVDPASPLLGNPLTLRVRFERLDSAPGAGHMLVGSLNAALARVFTLEDLDAQTADQIRAAEAQIAELEDWIDDTERELRQVRRASRPRRYIGAYRRITPYYDYWCRHCCHHCHYCTPEECICLPHRGPCRWRCCCPLQTGPPAADIVAYEASPAYVDPPAPPHYRDTIDTYKAQRRELRDEIGRLKRLFRQELGAARHRIHLLLPPSWSPPAKLPRHFQAGVRVTQVRWDRAAYLPVLIIDGALLHSDELGVAGP